MLVDANGRPLQREPEPLPPGSVANTPLNFTTAFINAIANSDREMYRWMLRKTGLIDKWNTESGTHKCKD